MNYVQLLAHFIATGGFLGYSPYAPGTLASLVTVFVLFFLPAMTLHITLLVGIALVLISACSANITARVLRSKDPSCIVIDEVLGMYLACMMLPKIWWFYVLAFLSFRFFDIVKPYPIYLCERVAYKNLGIIFDDAVAGLVTLGILIVLLMSLGF